MIARLSALLKASGEFDALPGERQNRTIFADERGCGTQSLATHQGAGTRPRTATSFLMFQLKAGQLLRLQLRGLRFLHVSKNQHDDHKGCGQAHEHLDDEENGISVELGASNYPIPQNSNKGTDYSHSQENDYERECSLIIVAQRYSLSV
ncbi:MAG: hypothetical protein LAN61_02520 [Acidobacteriia bacterium]|nr:hypothetical protein [Terriglobia bacterium]